MISVSSSIGNIVTGVSARFHGHCRTQAQVFLRVSPKGVLGLSSIVLGSTSLRFRLGVTGPRLLAGIVANLAGDLLPDLVVGVGSLDLVVGELDK